mmetsp:Transcript_29161/g.58228  ORF Transcript_29161/g.58228 Transcript_29161/m.58228 type:complete len:223 (+) Transcript_29161:206-874(+)
MKRQIIITLVLISAAMTVSAFSLRTSLPSITLVNPNAEKLHSVALPLRALFSSAPDNNSIEDNPVNVTFETATGAKSVNIQQGELLRSALLKRGISPHNGKSRLINCKGLGTCGTCAVEIYDNKAQSIGEDSYTPAVVPTERTTKEKLRLNFPPHGSEDQSPSLRLACQVQVEGDITVKKRTGFWGQDTDGKLADEYNAELWFGELEFILDDKSPKGRGGIN